VTTRDNTIKQTTADCQSLWKSSSLCCTWAMQKSFSFNQTES